MPAIWERGEPAVQWVSCDVYLLSNQVSALSHQEAADGEVWGQSFGPVWPNLATVQSIRLQDHATTRRHLWGDWLKDFLKFLQITKFIHTLVIFIKGNDRDEVREPVITRLAKNHSNITLKNLGTALFFFNQRWAFSISVRALNFQRIKGHLIIYRFFPERLSWHFQAGWSNRGCGKQCGHFNVLTPEWSLT